MSKIILTVEQDKAIKSCVERFEGNKEEIITLHAKDNDWYNDFELLNTISVSQMARILYEPGSYEVEKPEFKIGEWVIRIKAFIDNEELFSGKKPFKIVKFTDYCVVDKNGNNHSFNFIRHATPSEIIFAELGREVGEFKEGDIYKHKTGNTFEVSRVKNNSAEGAKRLYETGQLSGFYPATSYIEFPKP